MEEEGIKMNDNKKTKYFEIYNQIRQDIMSGKYPRGSFLPTENELMSKFNVSRTTIRNAVKLLKSDNLLRVTQGRGTQITPVASQDGYAFTLMGKTEVSTDFFGEKTEDIVGNPSTIDIIPATKDIAEHLGINENENVYRLQREKIMADTSFLYVTSYLSCKGFPNLEKNDGKIFFLYKFLEKEYGTQFTSTNIKITAVVADYVLSRILDVSVGNPLLEQKRTTHNQDGVIEYSISYSRPDYMSISISTYPENTLEDPFLTRGF